MGERLTPLGRTRDLAAAAEISHVVWGRPELDSGASSRSIGEDVLQLETPPTSNSWSNSQHSSADRRKAREHRCADEVAAPGSDGSSHRSSEVARRCVPSTSTARGKQSRLRDLEAAADMWTSVCEPLAGSAAGFQQDILPSGLTRETCDRLNNMLRAALSSQDGLWSAGSEKHVEGSCKACHYIHTNGGCTNALDCGYCHMPHTGMDRSRVCASKRAHCKKVVRCIRLYCNGQEALFKELADVAARRSKYMQCILQEEAAPEPESMKQSSILSL